MSSGKICFIGALAKGDFNLVYVLPSLLKYTILSPVGILRLLPNLFLSDFSIPVGGIKKPPEN